MPVQTLEHTQNLAEVGFEAQFVAVCPVTDVPFVGRATVVYTPSRLLLEFTSVENWLKEPQVGTVEDVAARVFDALMAVAKPLRLRVKAEAVAVVHGPAYAVKDSRG